MPSKQEQQPDFDFVVVGGGSSGCIVAAELARRTSLRVLLLECGPRAEANPETLAADGYKDAFANDEVIWERFSEPQRQCGGQRLFMGTGTGMGGSGSVNGMVYTRGAREDFAEWPEGWKWEDVQEDFEAVEARLLVRSRQENAFNEACIVAAEEVGFRRSKNLNDGDMSGVLGYNAMNYQGASRRSSYVAFIRDDKPETLTVCSGARAHKVLLVGKRAVGVEYRVGDGALQTVRATREVVLCAGALESPKLLMLSGIGPTHELQAQGIDVVHALAEVGQNLHDHPNVTVFFRGKKEVDCNYPQLYGFHRANSGSNLPKGQSDTCYVFYPARSSLREAMLRLVPSIVLPHWLYGVPGLRALVRAGIRLAFCSALLRRQVARIYGIVLILGKPKSRGSIGLVSARVEDQARLDPAYFSDPEDLETMVLAVEKARAIARAEGLRAWGNRELMPGRRKQRSSDLRRWIENNAMTTYHFAGTCRMHDSAGVVDPELRVRGIERLRVADASVIPTTPVSALNAPSMMIAYRAARWMVEDLRRAIDPQD